ISLTPILVLNLRCSLFREASADYIVSARSKNLPSRVIWVTHIFRNSLVATVNLLGVTTGWLFGGVVVIEMVFSIPGIGHLMVSSIFTRDYLVVEAVTMIMALGIVATNFIVDIATYFSTQGWICEHHCPVVQTLRPAASPIPSMDSGRGGFYCGHEPVRCYFCPFHCAIRPFRAGVHRGVASTE